MTDTPTLPAKPFDASKYQPVPSGLLLLTKQMVFTQEDWGFHESPASYCERYEHDAQARLTVDRALLMFMKLMERDVAAGLTKRDPYSGEDLGVKETRSRWYVDPGENALVGAGNLRTAPDYWFTFVKQRWVKDICPALAFYNAEPNPDPKSAHTEQAIKRNLNARNPRRAAAINFLREFGMEPARHPLFEGYEFKEAKEPEPNAPPAGNTGASKKGK